MSRNRVDNRAHMIYDLLVLHLGEGFTISELCEVLNLADSATTRSAINRARDLATDAGYHFPPAVPANHFQYMVTDRAADALDPTLHMGRIESGVRRRKEAGLEFLRRQRHTLPADLRPVADMALTVQEEVATATATIQKAADDMVSNLVKVRRGQRQENDHDDG